MTRPNLVQRYMDEVINYGGYRATRGQAIVAMRREGHDPKLIDAYIGYAKTITPEEAERLLPWPAIEED